MKREQMKQMLKAIRVARARDLYIADQIYENARRKLIEEDKEMYRSVYTEVRKEEREEEEKE